MLRTRLVLVAAAMLCTATAAANSSFRITSSKPHARGVQVNLAYQQWGGSRRVHLYASNSQPGFQPGGSSLGVHSMGREQGTIKVVVDYRKTGLHPGDQLYISGLWQGCGHRWGISGRDAGTIVLPQKARKARPRQAAKSAGKSPRRQRRAAR